MSHFSPYEVLGVSPEATIKDIKRKYRELVREFTPEHHPDKFMEIRSAYDALMSTEVEEQEKFPIYKKPLEFLKQDTQTQQDTLNPLVILGEIFETPYSTAVELKKLLKNK